MRVCRTFCAASGPGGVAWVDVLDSLAAIGARCGLAACGGSSDSGFDAEPVCAEQRCERREGRGQASGSITVWVDSVRLPAAKAYANGASRTCR